MDPRPLAGNVHPSYDGLPARSAFRLRDRIVDYQLSETAVLFRTGELTAEQLTIAYLARIYEFDAVLDARVTDTGYRLSMHIDAQQALTRARLADQWLSNPDDPRGPAPLLCGIVLGVGESLAPYTRRFTDGSPLVSRLLEQGAILLGPLHGPLCPGDSSAGASAISPVARLCTAALAETADEAFMVPTAANATSGIKPSLGLAMGWDIPGSIARSVRDASLVLTAIAGTDPHRLCAPLQWPVTPSTGEAPLAGIGIGVPQPPSSAGDTDYWQTFERFRYQLSELGARVLEFPGKPLRPQHDWESALVEHRLDFMLVTPEDSPLERHTRTLPNVPGWPMVTFPIGQRSNDTSRSATINAAFCGPHMSDARLIQVALDYQANHPHYHDAATLRPQFKWPNRRPPALTVPRKVWPRD